MLKNHKAISTSFAKLGLFLVLQAADCLGLAKKEKHKKEEPTKGVAPAAGSASTTLPEKEVEKKPIAKVLPQKVETDTETETETKAVAETEDTTTGGEASGSKAPEQIATVANLSEWHFNAEGKFVDKGGTPYRHVNDATYGLVLKKAKEQVVERLKNEAGMEDKGSFFATNNFSSMAQNALNTNVMVLVPGLLNAGAGVWSGSVLVNEGLNGGSILPIIKEAPQQGYQYFVMPKSTKVGDIQAAFAFVQNFSPSEIKIVAHSQGIENVITEIEKYSKVKEKGKVVYVGGGPQDRYVLTSEAWQKFSATHPLAISIVIAPVGSRNGTKYDLITPSDDVQQVLKAFK